MTTATCCFPKCDFLAPEDWTTCYRHRIAGERRDPNSVDRLRSLFMKIEVNFIDARVILQGIEDPTVEQLGKMAELYCSVSRELRTFSKVMSDILAEVLTQEDKLAEITELDRRIMGDQEFDTELRHYWWRAERARRDNQ